MPCLLLLIVVAFPRVVLALMFLLSSYLQRAYHGLLIPLLGFFFCRSPPWPTPGW